MRMPKDLFTALDQAFSKMNEASPLKEIQNRYKQEGLSDKRFRWDCFWSLTNTFLPKHWVSDECYKRCDLNDDHLDTAVRKIMKKYI